MLFDHLSTEHAGLDHNVTVVDVTDCYRMFRDGTEVPDPPIVRAPWPDAFYECSVSSAGEDARLGVHLFEVPDIHRFRAFMNKVHDASIDELLPRELLKPRPAGTSYLLGSVYYRRDKHSRAGLVFLTAFAVHPDGTLDENTLYFRTNPDNFDIRAPEETEMTSLLSPTFLAIHLLHCKNVGTIDHTPPPKVVAKRLRKGKPPGVTFKTLVVSVPGTRTPVRLYPPGEPQSKNARHLVRGHFKTYTKEKPLLGRHHGTFFFVQHIRGRDHTREIVKEYALEKEKP